VDTGKQFLQFARGLDPWKKLEVFAVLVNFVAACFSLSSVVFVRRDFGERYLGWINLAFAYTVPVNFAVFGNLVARSQGHGMSWSMIAAWLAFVAVSMFHRLVIWRRQRTGEQWHSYYVGMSLLPLPVSEEVKLKWIEPSLVLALAALCWALSAELLAVWLALSSMALWLHTHLLFYYREQAVLDAIDAQLEARHLGDALQGKPARQTAGVVMAESVRKRVQSDPGLVAAFASLSPELKAMMSPVIREQSVAAAA